MLALRPRFLASTLRAAPSTPLSASRRGVPLIAAQTLRSPLRSMASSSAPLQEWLVICPDFPNALDKRLGVRPKHLEGLKDDPDTFWLFGGAMLEEPIKEGDAGPPKMKGSAMLIGAKTREEVVERLQRDVYVTGQVWDWEKVQIIPFKSALRKGL